MTWPFLTGGTSTAAVALEKLTTDRRIFLAGGKPWRWKGVSAFPLCRLFADGAIANVTAFLDAFNGFNVLRVWDYATWPTTGWESCTVAQWQRFLSIVGSLGWYVELTLLTDDDPARIAHAKELVQGLAGTTNLVIEIGNEPRTHKYIDCEALRATCDASGLLYASGNNALDEPFFGKFITHHSPRDGEWQRKGGHDLMEFYDGSGPEGPHDPWRMPAVADEPNRPDLDGYHEENFLAYFASCGLLGAGGTFHYEGGKYGQIPTAQEAACAKAALDGLNAFPEDTPNGSPGYARIDEQGKSIRTYTCGNCMVRIPPLTTTAAPQPGWTALDHYGITWRK